MKKTILLFILTITASIISAQSPVLQWAKSIGGVSTDLSYSLALDTSGNVYTTGSFTGTVDFDPNAGIVNITSVGNYDIFISKLDANGNFVWAKNMGCSNAGWATSIDVDLEGNVYTTGRFIGTTDFDPNGGVFNLTSTGTSDIFISKLDANGNFIWAKNVGNITGEESYFLTTDILGNVYITGQFRNTTDFDPNAGVFNLTSVGNEDIFVLKLDTSGNFKWAKSMGGVANDFGLSLVVDNLGNVYTTGAFAKTVDFDPGAGVFNITAYVPGQGDKEIFISKLDSAGDFVWAKHMGASTTSTRGFSIALDGANNVYTTGTFTGTADFDPNVGVFNLTPVGNGTDIFISKLDSSGNFIWAKNMGPITLGNVQGNSIAIDEQENVYTTGWFRGTVDFDPNAGTFNLTALGFNDIYVSKLDSAGNFVWAAGFISGTPSQIQKTGNTISVDAIGNIYTTGFYADTTDFDPNAGVFNLISSGLKDIFVHKMSQQGFGISENNKGASIHIYPNPSNGLYTIELASKAEVSISNVLGEVVLHQILDGGKQSIDILKQPTGIYFIQILIEGKQQVTKLVKD